MKTQIGGRWERTGRPGSAAAFKNQAFSSAISGTAMIFPEVTQQAGRWHSLCITDRADFRYRTLRMSSKRLLFVQDDPLLGSIYRDKLELAGWAVETARDGDVGLKMLEEMRPDLVVLDSLLPGIDLAGSILAIRAHSTVSQVPIYVLPTLHPSLANAAHDAGATRMLERLENPLSELLHVAAMPLGPGLPGEARQEPSRVSLEDHWREATRGAAPGTLAAVRQALHDLIHDSGNHTALRTLLQRVHSLAGQMALLGQSALSRLAASAEVLVFGLEETPERMTVSCLRTLGQAVDLMSELLEREGEAGEFNVSLGRVLVVEDEPAARELIIAAVQCVDLEADGLDAPADALAVLSHEAYDLIFLDVNMPEMNGFEVCTKVRTFPLHEKTPIIFLTGMTSFQNRVQSSLSGGNDFVAKPFNVAELGLKALIAVTRTRME